MAEDLRTGGKWSAAEDAILMNGIQEYGMNWEYLSTLLAKRTPIMCRNRYDLYLSKGVNKGPWTDDEDVIISRAVGRGEMKWSNIAKLLSNRNGKQCRERWFNHLDPQLKKTPWSDEEDELLIAVHQRLGNSWTRIALEIPGRSENEVKNRWYSAPMRRRLRSYSSGESSSSSTSSQRTSDPLNARMVISDADWLSFKIGCEYMRRVVIFVASGSAHMEMEDSTSVDDRGMMHNQASVDTTIKYLPSADISIDTQTYRNPHNGKDISLKSTSNNSSDHQDKKRHRRSTAASPSPSIVPTQLPWLPRSLSTSSLPGVSPMNTMQRSWRDFILSNDLLLARDDLSPTTSSTILTWDDNFTNLGGASKGNTSSNGNHGLRSLDSNHSHVHFSDPSTSLSSSNKISNHIGNHMYINRGHGGEVMNMHHMSQNSMGLNSDDIEALASIGWNDTPTVVSGSAGDGKEGSPQLSSNNTCMDESSSSGS